MEVGLDQILQISIRKFLSFSLLLRKLVGYAYTNSGCSLKLEGVLPCFFGDDAASEKAHTKEKISARNRRQREQRWIEGLELDLAVAIENVNGDGVGNGCWAGELAAIGETLAIDLQSITNTSLSFFI